MSPPNLLFICSDQHSYRFAGYAAHPLVQTPNIDRLADEGTIFANAYCGSPVCIPSRSSLMTGVFASDCSSFCNSTVWDGSHPTWGTLLQEAGYRTAAAGKLDLNGSCELGFEDLGTTNEHWENADLCSLFRRPLLGYRESSARLLSPEIRQEPHPDALVAERAVEFIHQRSSRDNHDPWALWVGFNLPHSPFSCLQEYADLYSPEAVDLPQESTEDIENTHLVYKMKRAIPAHLAPLGQERLRRLRTAYYAMITELDSYVGLLLTALEETAESENTIVIYTSDHGEQLGEHGLWAKNTLYEDSAHVPLTACGPGIPAATRVDEAVGHVDLIPTLLEAAGADNRPELRGNSLWSLMRGEPSNHPGFAYVENHSGENCTGSFAIREGDFKYMHFTWFDDALYNVKVDPGERYNLIDDPSARPHAEHLLSVLESLVDPEEVTRRAFDVQRDYLNDYVAARSESELAEAFRRFGPEFAKAMAAKCKSGSLG